MTLARVHLVAPGADLLDLAAERIVTQHQALLPDLSSLTLLLPAMGAAPRLRRLLAAHAGRGLLGPTLATLPRFAQSQAPPKTAWTALDCRLRLTSVLSGRRNLFPGVDPAQAADGLYALFEELIAHELSPGTDEAQFQARLQKAYAAPASGFLSREARIVQLLFNAYLEETAGRSPAEVYRQQLAAAFAAQKSDAPLVLLGHDQFAPAELAALKIALAKGRAELWLQGRRDGHDGRATDELCRQLGHEPVMVAAPAAVQDALLDAAFASTAEVPALAAAAAGVHQLVQASGPEHEARCVDLAIREALLAGSTDVVVVSQDRRLARRLRALLERAGVGLDDPVGWALSTSSAAACVNAWLECRAGDFGFRPLLTLLKSDFSATPPQALRALDRDLIHARGIEHGLAAYLCAADESPDAQALLSRLREAARRMPEWNRPAPGDVWCRSLQDSLTLLEFWPRLLQDEAGARLAGLIEELGRALREHRLMLDGDGFRDLLDRLLERETFVPSGTRGPVRLTTLEQSQNLRCDLLILAGVTRGQWPGPPPAEPLLNAAVRRELGLPSWEGRHALALARLRRLLQSAPRVLMTYAPESAGEEAVLSPWIEALEAAAGPVLRDTRLARLAGQCDTEIAADDDAPPPPATERPAPRAIPALIPAEISASAHQSLVDCPYQFHAGQVLGLRAERAPDEDPDRSEYGERVHRILQRFTESGALDGRAEAQARLEKIAQDVFAPDLRSHVLAQLWLAEFCSRLPFLLDWLLQRPAHREIRSEARLTRALGAHSLSGRCDRLEIGADGRHVLVDYKTGAVPDEDQVQAGEAVQLLHYAALDPAVTRVEYLALKDGEKNLVIEEGLPELRERAMQRLAASLSSVAQGQALSAHGDDDTCERCDYRGLCRKGDWRE